MGRAVRQFEKEASRRLGTGVEYVAWNCMGRALRQFEKEVSFRPATGEVLTDTLKKAWEYRAQNQSFVSIEN